MFEYRYGIKLKKVTADAAALRILRKYFPNQSLSELRTKVQAHDYVLHSHMEEYNSDFQVAKLMQEFDKAGIETELFEEYRYAVLGRLAVRGILNLLVGGTMFGGNLL